MKRKLDSLSEKNVPSSHQYGANFLYNVEKLEQNNFLFFCYIRVKIVIFYTLILTRKVILWCFLMSETSEKNPQFNISSQNLNENVLFFQMRWKSNQYMIPTFP